MLAATGPHNRLSPPRPKANEASPPMVVLLAVSYTHLTLPTNREV